MLPASIKKICLKWLGFKWTESESESEPEAELGGTSRIQDNDRPLCPCSTMPGLQNTTWGLPAMTLRPLEINLYFFFSSTWPPFIRNIIGKQHRTPTATTTTTKHHFEEKSCICRYKISQDWFFLLYSGMSLASAMFLSILYKQWSNKRLNLGRHHEGSCEHILDILKICFQVVWLETLSTIQGKGLT